MTHRDDTGRDMNWRAALRELAIYAATGGALLAVLHLGRCTANAIGV